MRSYRKNRKTTAIFIVAVVLIADAVTKWLAGNLEHTIVVIPSFFNIVHVENSFAAFGISFFLPNQLVRIFLIIISIIFILIIGYKLIFGNNSHNNQEYIALSLILSGAIGNLWQRVIEGKVTDFLDFYLYGMHWPAFNIADSAITIGAILFAIAAYKSSDKSSER